MFSCKRKRFQKIYKAISTEVSLALGPMSRDGNCVMLTGSSSQYFKMEPNPGPLASPIAGTTYNLKTSEKGLTTEWTSRFVARCKPFVQAS